MTDTPTLRRMGFRTRWKGGPRKKVIVPPDEPVMDPRTVLVNGIPVLVDGQPVLGG